MTVVYFFVNLIVAAAICSDTRAEDTLVKVKEGWLRGDKLELVTKDGCYFSFKGIPYAAPPIGKLRFKATEPALSWNGIRSAKTHGPNCPQVDIVTNEYIPGNEDCLFLNVYTINMKPENLLPVIVFIHGGGFKSGSGDENNYGPDFLVQYGIVLVTINYRLEALGFLCLDTEDVPGNAGMKDQVTALRWVKKNIKNFGGDPDNVTIFGQSAGAASVLLHLLSPMSRGLFKRAISNSGAPFCDWALNFEPRRRAFIFAKQLGLHTDDPQLLLEFLQDVSVSKLINVTVTVLDLEENISKDLTKMYSFLPVTEKNFGNEHFLTETPEELLTKGNIKEADVLMGYTTQESLLLVDTFDKLYELYENNPEMLVPKKLILQCTASEILKISDKIRQHYFGNKQISNKTIDAFADIISEAPFNFNIQKYAKALPNTIKKYFYLFSAISERNVYGNEGIKYGIKGVAHLDDLNYLFDPKKFNLPIDKNSTSYKIIQQTCTLYTNFAKFGNPTPDTSLGVIWPTFDDITASYMDIGEQLVTRQGLDAEIMKFWQSVYDEADCCWKY